MSVDDLSKEPDVESSSDDKTSPEPDVEFRGDDRPSPKSDLKTPKDGNVSKNTDVKALIDRFGTPVLALVVAVLLIVIIADEFFDDDDGGGGGNYTGEFDMDSRNFSASGNNPFFIMDPGYQLVMEGDDDGITVKVIITVLNETHVVDGVETRVIEEAEYENGKIIEISRNYFAIDTITNSVFYFGEDVDDYANDVIVGHDGVWLAGKDGAKAGLIMPGLNLVGAKYYQEYYPGVAMDRAQTVSVTHTLTTPKGTFTDCLMTMETNPLEDEEGEFKVYAPGIGQIQDEELLLINYGYNIITV